jgi:signal transduction histidine kinase
MPRRRVAPHRRFVLTLYQRLALSYLLLLGLLLGLGLHGSSLLRRAAQDGFARQAIALTAVAVLFGALVSAGCLWSVVRPLRRAASSARRIGQGELQHRVEWRSRDHLGAIATEINRMAVLIRDLRDTESGRKQLEHQLSDAVVQSIFEPVVVTDAKGQVLKLNQAATEVLGEHSADRHALTRTPGGEQILRAVREAVAMRQPIAHEGDAAVLPLQIGEEKRSYRLRTTPMRDADGKLLGAVSVLEDITQIRDIDHFKTRFLTIASQKIRQPLEQVRLSLYTLSRGFAGELRPLQADLVHGAELETERLNDLMSDLIEVSELESGRREIRMERVRPIDVFRETYLRHREEAQRKKIDLEIRAFSDLSHINADRRALRSIMDNLMTNALRCTAEGGSIQMEAKEHKDMVQFAVRDSGHGIAAERLPGIFGRFNAGPGEGTGLGLALVRRLVELLGGQVSVESRLGHGSKFSFTIPAATGVPTRHPIEVG